LDKQFYRALQFENYLNKNFILFRAIRKEAKGKELFDRFKVTSTPTVMVVTPKGEEIDRLIGYGPPPENFKDRLEETYKSEQNYLSLIRSFTLNPNDLKTAVLLAQKYLYRDDYTSAEKMRTVIMAQVDEARKLMVPLLDLEGEVSAYEYARFLEPFQSPNKVLDFAKEFPNSKLLNELFRELAHLLWREDTREDAMKIYDELFKIYPDNLDLIAPYVNYCTNAKFNLEQATKLADAVYKIGTFEAQGRIAYDYARLLLYKGEKSKAKTVYGDNFAQLLWKNQDTSGLNSYAWFWAWEKDNLLSALDAAKKSLQLKDDANTWDTLSMVYWKMKDYQNALRAEEKALELAGGQEENFEKRIKEIKKDMEKGK
jgi:tetratricopeptide (TPR) repeat protein